MKSWPVSCWRFFSIGAFQLFALLLTTRACVRRKRDG